MSAPADDAELRDQINKRFTLNWLIQGAAQHAGMTFQHLVRDGLDAVHPELVLLYDQYALINLLQYWQADVARAFGHPQHFWERAETDPTHPFHGHPVLSRHGGPLAAESYRRGRERCKEKGLSDVPDDYVFAFQALEVIRCLKEREAGSTPMLVELAKQAVTMAWGIGPDRLEAALTNDVAFGRVTPPRTRAGRAFLSGVVGYGGVLRREGRLMVVGRGTNWYLMAKELVKGTAELVCLHGLNRLPDDVYRRVVEAADGIDHEPWMLQTGGELWRRFLAALPGNRPVAEMLMHVARLPPRPLESLILAVIEQPAWAKELMAGVGASGGDADTA